MPVPSNDQTKQSPGYSGLRVIVLALFIIVAAIVAVSFAANHLRNGFELEYREQMNYKLRELASSSAFLIQGDDLLGDPEVAQKKYAAALPAMIIDSGADNQLRKSYGLYLYTNGSLTPLLQSSTEMRAMEVPVSEWLTTQADPYYIYDQNRSIVLTPIKDSQGKVAGLFELSGEFSFLDVFGAKIERNVLFVVLVSVFAGIIIFSFQYTVPLLISFIRKKGGRI